MSMLEDFWLPRREGGRGTEISTLPGGQNLGEIQDVQYFQKRVYKSLHVPVSRLEQDQGFSIGKTAEITRDEVKFSKFVQRLRKRFTGLFQDLLKTQLVLKGIITIEDWDSIKSHIQYDFLQDGHFAELKNSELLRERLNLANEVTPYVGKYFSVEFLRKNVLRQTDEEIEEIDRQIASEVQDGMIADPLEGEEEESEIEKDILNKGENDE
jgi:hypothetical protein